MEIREYVQKPPRIKAVRVKRGSLEEIKSFFLEAPFEVMGVEESGVFRIGIRPEVRASSDPRIQMIPEGVMLCWNQSGSVWIIDPPIFFTQYEEVDE